MRRRDRARDHAEEFTVGCSQALRQHDAPAASQRVLLQRDGNPLRSPGFMVEEVALIGDRQHRHRPNVGGVDQDAVRIENFQRSDLGRTSGARAQSLMHRQRRHRAAERFGRRLPHLAGSADDVVLHRQEIVDFAVVMQRQQQCGVGQLALAVAQRLLLEIADSQRGGDRNTGNQQGAAQDQPEDRAKTQHPGDGRVLADVRRRFESRIWGPDVLHPAKTTCHR